MEILDVEFAGKRKMMDELFAKINHQRPVKGNKKSLTRYAMQIAHYVNDMEDNDCPVTSSSEAPFFMSQLLSKLDPKDNAEFGREMKRNKKEETIPNLIQWIHKESSLRSRGKLDLESSFEERGQQPGSFNRRTGNYAGDFFDVSKSSPCPFGCQAKNLLVACPHYQTLTVDERWEFVGIFGISDFVLQSHHTKDCKKSDCTTCSRCKKNHHRYLHNKRKDQEKPPLDPNAVPVQTHDDNTVRHADMNTLKHNSDVKTVTGLLQVQKIKVDNSKGELIQILAMQTLVLIQVFSLKQQLKKLGLSVWGAISAKITQLCNYSNILSLI